MRMVLYVVVQTLHSTSSPHPRRTVKWEGTRGGWGVGGMAVRTLDTIERTYSCDVHTPTLYVETVGKGTSFGLFLTPEKS